MKNVIFCGLKNNSEKTHEMMNFYIYIYIYNTYIYIKIHNTNHMKLYKNMNIIQ